MKVIQVSLGEKKDKPFFVAWFPTEKDLEEFKKKLKEYGIELDIEYEGMCG